jgi:large subunit ribosomal protein L28
LFIPKSFAYNAPLEFPSEELVMAQVCDICGKGPKKARKITRRGKSKREGGIGLNITGVHKRRQMPNLQTIRAIIDGKPQRVLVCTRCIRSGKVQKRSIARRTPEKLPVAS